MGQHDATFDGNHSTYLGTDQSTVRGADHDANKAVVRRLVDEVVNRGQTRLLADLVAPEHVSHEPIGDHYGPEGVRIDLADYRVGFPDLEVTLDELLAEGDRVIRRFTLRGTHTGPFMGLAPTGRRVEMAGIGIDRLAGGRLVETWKSCDLFGLLRQLGAGVGAGAPPVGAGG